MEGWLTKLSRQRYFILRDGILYWFTSATEPVGDLASKCTGSINLQNCTVKESPDKQFTIAIEGPIKTYYVKGKNDSEVSKWMNALSDAISKAIIKNQEMGKHMKSGWLEKKGRKRYYVLKEAILSWYLNEQTGKAQGQLDIKRCKIGPPTTAPDGKVYIVVSVPYRDNIEYKLFCPGGINECKSWAKSMIDAQETFTKKQVNRDTVASSTSNEAAISKSGWLEKKGQKRFFILKNYLLCWYNQEPMDETVGINGSLNIKGCQIAHVEYTLTIKPTVGISYSLKATSVEEAEDWVQVISTASNKADINSFRKVNMFEATKREGWLNRLPLGKSLFTSGQKVERRFLRVDNGDLKWFDSDLWQSTTPKEVLHLARCQLYEFNDNTFMIRTGHGRDYPFQCTDTSERNQWMISLQFYIQKANEEMQSAVIRDQFLVGGRTHGERWVVLTKDNILLWFNHVVPPSNVVMANANGHLRVSLCHIEQNIERQLTFSIWQPRQIEKIAFSEKLTISTPTGVVDKFQEKITFTTPDQQSYDWWFDTLKAITEGKEVGNSNEKKLSLVFGVPLAELLKREGTTIPIIVTKCIDFISKNGKEVQGIFRLSGQAGIIKKYTENFDSGEIFDFPLDLDVHAVTGILKSWLRELPEPLFSFEYYEDLIAIDDYLCLKNIIEKLPTENQNVIKYLFKFLHEITLYSEITSMGVPNIAIVFGPNCLRRQDADEAVTGLAETPSVLKVMQILITNYYKIYGGEPPSKPVFNTPSSPQPPSSLPPRHGLPPPSTPPPLGLPPPSTPPPSMQSTQPKPVTRTLSHLPPKRPDNQTYITRATSAKSFAKPPSHWPLRNNTKQNNYPAEEDTVIEKEETYNDDEIEEILRDLGDT